MIILLEYTESFQWKIRPETNNQLNILGDWEPVKVEVKDNEYNNYNAQYDYLAAALYRVSGDLELDLVGLAPAELGVHPHMKKILDEGLDPKFINDLRNLLKLGNVQIERLDIMFETNGYGGYVGSGSTTENRWILGLNLMLAYHQINNNYRPQSYNQDGLFGYVMVHELGHLITLDTPKEVNPNISQINCTNLYLREGCFKDKSTLNKFHDEFYKESPVLNHPTHVSEYASVDITEDIAETIAFYTHQNTLPNVDTLSSGALHKIHFMKQQEAIIELRTPIRELLKIDGLPVNYNAIRAFQMRFREGEISCMHPNKPLAE